MFAFGGDSGSATMWAKEKEKAERADVRSALMFFYTIGACKGWRVNP